MHTQVYAYFQATELASKGGTNVASYVRNAYKAAVASSLLPQINLTGLCKKTGKNTKIALLGTNLFHIMHCKYTL